MTVSIPDNGGGIKAKPSIRCVIFDMDGTLLDTEALSCKAVIQAFASVNLTIPNDTLASLEDGGFLLPWELKRRILGLRGSGVWY